MSDGTQGITGHGGVWNGIFHGHHVPFQMNVVLLGFLFVLLTHLGLGLYTTQWNPEVGERLLNPFTSQVASASAGKTVVSSWVITPFRDIAIALGLWSADGQNFGNPLEWKFVWAWLILLVLWSFFAPAICRLASMRIARDENLGMVDALKFAAGKFQTTALVVLIVLGAALAIFVINAVLGYLVGIPYVGEVLAVLFAPAYLVLALLMLWLLSGLAVGVNLMASGIAAEGSDGLDGISRAINYLFSRPWHVILHYALIFVSLLVLLGMGELFFGLTRCSTSLFWDSANVEAPYHKIVSSGDDKRSGWYADVIYDVVEPEGEGSSRTDWYRGQVLETKQNTVKMQVVAQEVNGEESRFPILGAGNSVQVFNYTVPAEGQDTSSPEYRARHGQARVIAESDVHHVNWWSRFWYSVSYLILYLVKFLIAGYAAGYFLAATTLSYFLLRKEVDGTETDDVYFEDEDMDLGGSGATLAPAPAPPAAPSEPAKSESKPAESAKSESKPADKPAAPPAKSESAPTPPSGPTGQAPASPVVPEPPKEG